MNRSKLAAGLTKLAFITANHDQSERAAQILDEVSQSLRDGVRHNPPIRWNKYQRDTYNMIIDALEGDL